VYYVIYVVPFKGMKPVLVKIARLLM